jgi:hypothetical protein
LFKYFTFIKTLKTVVLPEPDEPIIEQHHQHTKRPCMLMDQEDMKIRKKANEDLQGIFYPGSTKKGNF